MLSEAWRGGRVGLSDTCYLKTSRNEWEYEGCLGIRFRGGRRGMDSFAKTSFGGIGVFQAWIRGFLDSFLVFSFRWEIEREFLIVRRIMQEEKAWDGTVHGGRLAGEGELGQRGDVSGRGGGMGPRMREDTGRERRGWLWGAIDSSLRFATFRMTCGVRCARNEMWLEG